MNSKFHLFGDSHIGIINHKDIIKHQFNACSAMGLNNLSSISGYRKKFLNLYNNIPKNEKIMLKFGQVDTEFVYYLKLTKKYISFLEFAQYSIDKFKKCNYIIYIHTIYKGYTCKKKCYPTSFYET